MRMLSPLVLMCFLCGCEAKKDRQAQFDEHGNDGCCISLNPEEKTAWQNYQEWKRTNVITYTITHIAIRDGEYRQLTNWMRWMKESR